MGHFFLLPSLILIYTSVALANPQAQWELWKQKTFNTALTSPKSFLNAYSLEQQNSGQSLYLVLGPKKNKALNRWLKKEPKSFYAKAEHLGAKIRLQIRGETAGYLTAEKDNRRKEFKLPDGSLAEVVYGHRNQKLWAYLYDPDQINKFSGFRFYPFNAKAIVKANFKAHEPQFVSYKTVQGDPTQVNQVGNVSFMMQGKELFLPAYNWQKNTKRLAYIALVYTDEARGQETYAGGRELVVDLDAPLKDGQELSLDFNRTLNFYCAHSPFWHCPVGLQKHLPLRVEAGEMLPKRRIVQ